MSEVILSCPFCGRESGKYSPNEYRVYCTNCGARGPVAGNGVKSFAIEIWNDGMYQGTIKKDR